MSNQFCGKIISCCFFVVIIALSGCVYLPREPIKIEISRISNSDAELAVIDFVENYDFLEFTGLAYDDSTHFRLDWRDNRGDQFIGNISNLLVSAKTYYLENTNYRRGELSYNITIANISFSEREYIPALQFGAFRVSENTCLIYDNDNPIPQDFWTLMNLPEWFWVCELNLHYILRQNYQQDEYYFTEIIILNPTEKILGLIADFGYSGWVA